MHFSRLQPAGGQKDGAQEAACPGAAPALQAMAALTEGSLTAEGVRGCVAAWSAISAGNSALQVRSWAQSSVIFRVRMSRDRL